MELHPHLTAIVEKASRYKRMNEAPLSAVRGAAAKLLDTGLPREMVGSVETITIQGPDRSIPLRIYRPDDEVGRAVILFLHGGGFAICGLETHDAMCRQICRRSEAVVVSVDYALAPEHPYPAGLVDGRVAARWVVGNAERIGADPRRMALCGDSAGGNLAIGLALSGIHSTALALIYPVTDHYSAGRRSYADRGAACGLTDGEMRWFWDMYLPDAALAGRPDVSPARSATLSGLPRSYVATAEHDVLRDEGLAFVQRLREAGVPVTHRHYGDMNHGFLNWVGVVDRASEAMDDLGAWLRQALANPEDGPCQ